MSRIEHGDEDKPCRACSDFKSWAKLQRKSHPAPISKKPGPPPECPLDKEDLGKATWGYLHSMAAYYPDKPSSKEVKAMTNFFQIFAHFYPCEPCALDFQNDIKDNPVRAESREELGQWLCERHNTVNKKLGKPLFDCSKIQERWRDGWKDGSCD